MNGEDSSMTKNQESEEVEGWTVNLYCDLVDLASEHFGLEKTSPAVEAFADALWDYLEGHTR